MNVTTDPALWCDLCSKYVSAINPAVALALELEPVICLNCLRLAVEACEASQGDRIVRGQRE